MFSRIVFSTFSRFFDILYIFRDSRDFQDFSKNLRFSRFFDISRDFRDFSWFSEIFRDVLRFSRFWNSFRDFRRFSCIYGSCTVHVGFMYACQTRGGKLKVCCNFSCRQRPTMGMPPTPPKLGSTCLVGPSVRTAAGGFDGSLELGC